MPKIIPGARQVGVSLEQTSGAFAFLTATGLKAEAASTALSNAMKSMSTPDVVYGSKTKGGFKGLGIDIFDATGKVRDLVSIATDLNTKMAGLTDEQRMKKFASIGLDMESSMAFSKMSQGVDQLKDSIDFVTDSQGQLNKAVEIVKDPMDSWLIMEYD
ncbi:phage tail tape measure protein [Pedobacter sp. NJ-S-72]